MLWHSDRTSLREKITLIILLYLFDAIKRLFSNKTSYPRHKKQASSKNADTENINVVIRSRKKPQWVTNEVIKIKALMPKASCRIISLIFNQRHQQKETIGKTFVDYTIRNHLYEIQQQRKKIKAQPAYPIPFNKVWGMDITFVQEKPVLGIIEHHSRKALTLIPLKQKTSITILRRLLDILEVTPKPQYIRTDNEICFNSRLIKFAFWVLGIKHQTIDKHCPWQNGRVERFFGTLKATIKHLPKQNDSDLPYLIHSFEFWYNQIRPHQNLDNQIPEFIFQKKMKQWQRENPPDG